MMYNNANPITGQFQATLNNVEKKIKTGAWMPGERLPSLNNLAKEFGVGLSTLREVLRILESQDMITIEQGRGTFVRTHQMNMAQTSRPLNKFTALTLKRLFEARTILEPEFSGMAAQRGFMDEIQEIYRAAEKMAKQVDHYERFNDADLNFHLMIARASHNEVLFNMFKTLENQMSESLKQTNLMPGMIHKAVHYHLMIAEAIRDRDGKRARSLMLSHLSDVSYELTLLELNDDGIQQNS